MKKRFMGIVFIFTILFSLYIPVAVQAVSDKTPPELTSITTNNNSFFGGDKITFSIVGTDDLSGLKHIMIEYRLKSKPSNRFSIEFDNNGSTNSFSGTYTLPEKTAPGEWEAFAIQIWDGAGNLNTYISEVPEHEQIVRFPSLGFTVKQKPGADFVPPVLNSISVKNKVISAPGKIEIVANATDDKSSTVTIQVTYIIRGEQHATNLVKTSGNTYAGSINVDANAKYQPAKLRFVLVQDAAGNQVWYSYDPSEHPFGEESLKLNVNLDVSFSNAVSDSVPPMLVDFGYSSTNVTAPGVMNIWANAYDNLSGIAEIKMHYIGKDQSGKTIDHWILYPAYDDKTKKYVSNFTFSQYYPNAEFSVVRIELTDGAGNKTVYATEPQEQEKPLKKTTVKLTKAITGNVAGGTMNEDYVEKIKAAKNDDTILIDSTSNPVVIKEAFEAIKDTNKKLILVNDGIQWVFSGDDITEATKNINTKISLYKFDGYGNETLLDYFSEESKGLVIEFAPNGVLPGKALIKIKADYTFRNYIGEKDLYIYHYQETENGLEAIASKIEMSADGYYEFYITHNSKYIVTPQKAKASAVVKDNTKLNNQPSKDGQSSETTSQSATESSSTSASSSLSTTQPQKASKGSQNLALVLVLVLIACILVAVVVFRKRLYELLQKLISFIQSKG